MARSCASASSRPSTRTRSGPSSSSATMNVPPRASAWVSSTFRASIPSSASAAPTCARVGRPPGEPKIRCTAAATPHPSTMAANTSFGKPGAEVQRRRGHEEHGELADPARRAGEVRRRGADDRDDHREAHHRVRRAVVEPGDDLEPLAEALVLDEHHAEQAADEPRADAGEDEVAGEAPPTRDQRGDADQPDCPERAEPVEEHEQRAERVGQRVEEFEEVALGFGEIVDVEARGDDQHERRTRRGASRSCAGGTAARMPARTSRGAACARSRTRWRRPSSRRSWCSRRSRSPCSIDRGDAAVDHDGLAGDERRIVGQQEPRHACDLLGLADAPEHG